MIGSCSFVTSGQKRMDPLTYLLRIDRFDRAILVVAQLCYFHVALTGYSIGQRAVVIEEIPPALKFDDGMVSRPSKARIQDVAPERKGSHWVRPGGIGNEVCVPSGIGEVVEPVIF